MRKFTTIVSADEDVLYLKLLENAAKSRTILLKLRIFHGKIYYTIFEMSDNHQMFEFLFHQAWMKQQIVDFKK